MSGEREGRCGLGKVWGERRERSEVRENKKGMGREKTE
jgi:hypothetical protein